METTKKKGTPSAEVASSSKAAKKKGTPSAEVASSSKAAKSESKVLLDRWAFMGGSKDEVCRRRMRACFASIKDKFNAKFEGSELVNEAGFITLTGLEGSTWEMAVAKLPSFWENRYRNPSVDKRLNGAEFSAQVFLRISAVLRSISKGNKELTQKFLTDITKYGDEVFLVDGLSE